MKIELKGFDVLDKKLQARLKETKPRVSAVTGFQTNYAVFVHEDLTAHHDVGQAKYLEQPARELKQELGNIIVEATKKGSPLDQALLLAALRLQREAQQLVPVDTGALRASAFSEIEK